jgi:hypothetical protein
MAEAFFLRKKLFAGHIRHERVNPVEGPSAFVLEFAVNKKSDICASVVPVPAAGGDCGAYGDIYHAWNLSDENLRQ